MKKMLKKLKSPKGFTLVELLVTIVVMLLVTQIISMTIQLATRYYTQSVRNSESQTICAALAEAVQDELQYATKVQPLPLGAPADENGYYPSYTYYSRARQHGSSCELVCGDDGRIYVRKADKDYALVGSETYTYGMKAELDCRWNRDGYFSVELKVLDGDQELASQSFDVYPLNDGN